MRAAGSAHRLLATTRPCPRKRVLRYRTVDLRSVVPPGRVSILEAARATRGSVPLDGTGAHLVSEHLVPIPAPFLRLVHGRVLTRDLLETLKLATVRRVTPRVRYGVSKTACDASTLHAVITHRFDVLTRFAQAMQKTAVQELRISAADGAGEVMTLDAVRHWLRAGVDQLDSKEREVFDRALRSSALLGVIFSMRQTLTALWSPSNASTEELVGHMEAWCGRADKSDVAALREFSRFLRRYETPFNA